jgi:hypothetical protein
MKGFLKQILPFRISLCVAPSLVFYIVIVDNVFVLLFIVLFIRLRFNAPDYFKLSTRFIGTFRLTGFTLL